jgi:hypothetical protein
VDRADEGVGAGREGRHVVRPGLDPVEDLAEEHDGRCAESLISTLCGIPASSFSNSILNGVSAGTVTSRWMNWMSFASIRTTTSPGSPDGAGLWVSRVAASTFAANHAS